MDVPIRRIWSAGADHRPSIGYRSARRKYAVEARGLALDALQVRKTKPAAIVERHFADFPAALDDQPQRLALRRGGYPLLEDVAAEGPSVHAADARPGHHALGESGTVPEHVGDPALAGRRETNREAEVGRAGQRLRAGAIGI